MDRRAAKLIEDAFEHAQNEEYGMAISCYDAALQIAPNDPGALTDKAVTLVAAGRPDEALAIYDGLIKNGLKSADILANRAAALHCLGRHEEAIASCDAALNSSPQMASAAVCKGYSLAALGRVQEASDMLQQALPARADPEIDGAAAGLEQNIRRLMMQARRAKRP